MTKLIFARFFALLTIICVLVAGIYLNAFGTNPNTLSSRAVMVSLQINK